MCWISNTKPKRLIADKNIIVYKLMEPGLLIHAVSLIAGYVYTLGELYSMPKLHVRRYCRDEDRYLLPEETAKHPVEYQIYEGFHSYKHLDTVIHEALASGHTSYKAYRCIIPKGAEYYIDEDNYCVVSNQIIIKEMI